jgi:DNA-binding MarR family transcriptional regulator
MRTIDATEPAAPPPADEASDPVTDEAVAELERFIRGQRRRIARDWSVGSLSSQHLHALMVLDADGPVPMRHLADALVCSTPNVTGLVDRMEERGLVERSRDTDDRRVVHVRLTPAGLRTLGEFEAVRTRSLRRILLAMGPPDRLRCRDAIRLMRETAERLDASPQATTSPETDRS